MSNEKVLEGLTEALTEALKPLAERLNAVEEKVALEKAENFKEDMLSDMNLLVEVSKQERKKQINGLVNLLTKGEE